MRSYSLFVLEGPAGCGKSSAIKELESRFGIPVIARDYQMEQRSWGQDAPLASMIKDYRLFFKFMTEAKPNRPYLMDRLFFSQLVYQPERSHIALSTPKLRVLARDLKHSFETVLSALYMEESIRSLDIDGVAGDTLRFNVVFIFLCPSYRTLSRFRHHSTKTYPFRVQLECNAYHNLGHFLELGNSQPDYYRSVSVKAEAIDYDDTEHYIDLASKIYERIKKYESTYGFSLSKY